MSKNPTARRLSRRGFLGRAGAAGGAMIAAPATLTACGGDSGADPAVVGDESYEPGSASLLVELGPEVEGINYPEDYVGPKARELEPFGDGETEFSILGRTIPELDYATNYYAGLVEEKTGVKVKYQPVPLGDDGVTTVNAMLSGGELPHALMTGMGLFSVSQVSVYGQQGMFLPLDKLIDEHAPHVREMFELFPDMRTLFTSPDGKMYAVPSMNDCFHCKSSNTRMWLNSAWFEEIGAEAPETLDEYTAVIDELKAWSKLPKNAGLTVASSDTMMSMFNFFMGSFTEVGQENKLLRDGKVTWGPTEDAYREGMIWIQEQFAKGRFSSSTLSMTTEQLQQMGDDPDGPRFAVVQGASQGSFATTVDFSDPANVASLMKPLAPMAGPGGVRTSAWDWYQIGSPNFVITTSCPDPVQMIRWADYQFELGMTISMGRGEKGKGWDYADTGAVGIDGEQAVYSVLPGGGDIPNQVWWEWGPFFKSMSQRHGEAVLDDSNSVEPSLYEAGKAYEPYRIDKELVVPPLAFDMEQSAVVGELETNLVQHLEQSFAAAASGKIDLTKDADWQAYVDKFTAIGVDDLLNVYQEAYDAQF